jgi:hypothetical protein
MATILVNDGHGSIQDGAGTETKSAREQHSHYILAQNTQLSTFKKFH